MRFGVFGKLLPTYGMIALVLACVTAIALSVAPRASRAQEPTESRPRRADAGSQPSQQPTASPTPVLTGPGRRIAPQLGEPPPPPILKPKPTPTPDPAGAEIDEGSRIRINTDLVTLQVRVIDRNNKPINDVRQDEIKILEDGVPQPIFSFTREEVPVTYGLAVDTSGSLRSQLNQVIDSAKSIINSNKRGDETFLERFVSSDKIETVQDFTASKDALLDGLDELYIEGGQTAVIDGVYLAAEHVGEYKKRNDDDRRRRALIVITDGEDRDSYYKEAQLFQRLREEDVQIYVIGFVNELDNEKGFIRKSPREKAVALINQLATETGGRAFFPNSVAELPGIANEIVRDLRTQYVISYDPTNKVHDGAYHAIKVTVAEVPGRDRRIALTRPGRTAEREGGSPRPSPKPVNNNARQPATNPARKTP
jgi:Ca-activated chloride channel family protein